jgi:hypothetical protein
MGGLIIKQVRHMPSCCGLRSFTSLQAVSLAQAHKSSVEDHDETAFLRSLIGVIFIGTPHRGGHGVRRASFLARIFQTFNISVRGDLIEYLAAGNDELIDLTSTYRSALDANRSENEIETLNLYEVKQTTFGIWPFQFRVWVRKG